MFVGIGKIIPYFQFCLWCDWQNLPVCKVLTHSLDSVPNTVGWKQMKGRLKKEQLRKLPFAAGPFPRSTAASLHAIARELTGISAWVSIMTHGLKHLYPFKISFFIILWHLNTCVYWSLGCFHPYPPLTPKFLFFPATLLTLMSTHWVWLGSLL